MLVATVQADANPVSNAEIVLFVALCAVLALRTRKKLIMLALIFVSSNRAEMSISI